MMPLTRTKENRVISFRELRVIHMKIIVTRKAKGIPTMVRMAFRNPMKKKIRTLTRQIPTRRFMLRVVTESSMCTRWSRVRTTSTFSLCRDGLKRSTVFSTRGRMSRAFPSSVLITVKATLSLPFSEVMTPGSRWDMRASDITSPTVRKEPSLSLRIMVSAICWRDR